MSQFVASPAPEIGRVQAARVGPIDEVVNRMLDARGALAQALMDGFAERTGLTSGAQRRYLWTDAFAVCNFMDLAGLTAQPRYDELAIRLVDAVHHMLGRHRVDESRSGWISGLAEEAGEEHPTLAGLRIGKPLPERARGEAFDPDIEWERDGQYFHYLTKWMHALDQMARARNDPRLLQWALELADTAYRRFTHGEGTHKRMYWKMSIDLMRPLVSSMGQHDALDGLVASLNLLSTSAGVGTKVSGPDLSDAIIDFSTMIDPASLATSDPLGIGGLLVDTYRLAELVQANARGADPRLFKALLAASMQGLHHFSRVTDLAAPANLRLAFRELGLAIGIAALTAIDRSAAAEMGALLPLLDSYTGLRNEIETFWMSPENRLVPSWIDHLDINDVMLATSLSPHGFLVRNVVGEKPGKFSPSP